MSARDESRTLPARGGVASAPRPLHNAVLLSVATLAAKGCAFVQLFVAARMLHASGLGDYSAVMGYVGLFAVATDLGLSTLAVRDAAQDRALLPRYLGNVLALRLVLSAATAAICIALSLALPYDATARAGIVIWALALFPIAVIGTAGIAFQAVERMAPYSALTAAIAALTAALSIAALLLGGRVVALIWVAASVNGVAALAALALAARIVPVRPRLEAAWWPLLLRAALPFSVLVLLNVLYSNADGLLVYFMKGKSDAGLYSVAYRLVVTLLTVAISPFNAAALPAFTRVGAASREALQRLVDAGVRIMLVVGVPVAVAATIYAREVVLIAGGPDYVSAAPAVQWLAWSFPCFTVLAILYNALYAVQRARDVATTFGVTLLVNVGLNLLLIPHFSYFGSAALTTASEALNVALAAWAVWRHVGPGLGSGLFNVWATVVRVAVAGLVMAAVMWILRPLGPVGPVAGLPAGALVYLAAIRLLRVLGTPERAILARLPLIGRYAAWL